MEWGHLDVASQREWLVTDGHGGYASGTVSSVLTRRYHGLLVAAMRPPLARRVLFSKIDARATYAGTTVDLTANRWHDGTIAPNGAVHLFDFSLEDGVPVWTYAFADARLEQRVWMDGEATTYVRFTSLAASSDIALRLKCYIEDRDFHSLTHAYDVPPPSTVQGTRATMRMGDGTEWTLCADRGTFAAEREWYYGLRYERETERGLDDAGDVYHALTIDASLAPGESLTLVASVEPVALVDAEASTARVASRTSSLLEAWRGAHRFASEPPAWIAQLVRAADQFIVERGTGTSVIAGYHWFGDWGRDTMIALPGLTLATGRPQLARSILQTFAGYVDGGMIPNCFPSEGEAPAYNSVDAPLWFIEATRAYYETTADTALLDELFEPLASIVAAYERGTRYAIGVDAHDGLLHAGENGVQLTWMDAKVADWVVTPRIGKPVEVNALWYNALRSLDLFAGTLGRDPSHYRELAGAVRRSFGRFWNAGDTYLFDVIDGPDGNDASIRPNALLAASLPFRAIDQATERAIVARAARSLLTPAGLRSLSPDDPAYVARYGGPPQERDSAYHRGTVWPWLIGPFVRAWCNAYGSATGAQRFLEAAALRMDVYGMGTVAEIADGDAPHDPRGAIAQAWSVGQMVQTWHDLQRTVDER